jgi:cytoplasmic iron level regulating protein YaaA (DUF328/UPF0246 family)
VTETINRYLQLEKQPMLVNLASDEYFKIIQPKILVGKILKISFKENKKGVYRVIGIHAKRARGLMVNYAVKNRIGNPEDLKNFNIEGYEFNPSLSTDDEFVYCRG